MKPLDFAYCYYYRGHQNEVWLLLYPVKYFLTPQRHPWGRLPTALEDLPSDLMPITAQTPVLPALSQGHAGGSGNTGFQGCNHYASFLFLCSNFQSCPRSQKKGTRIQRKPTKTGVLDARPQKNSSLQIVEY